PAGAAAIGGLLALVPPDAGMYKIASITDTGAVARVMVEKLIASQPGRAANPMYAPYAASPDNRAGTEADLETRIDEQPLPPDAGLADSEAAARGLLDKGGAQTVLWMESSTAVSGTFFEMPSVMVLEGAADWDSNSVRSALSEAAGKLWTTARLGAGWTSATAGRHPIERLDGLGRLMFATEGRRLFLSNDAAMLAEVLDRAGAAGSPAGLSYAAGFRHLRERPAFERVMAALDFGSPRPGGMGNSGGSGEPSFFSGNIASLSRTLANVAEVRVTQQEKGSATTQTVVYRLVP
ncbi:MAG TPA: hypothetical protein VME43_19465, partial [Bryobacteraceae bacterium]|nr:hypothetical protein [Bryobacteraceae bacterium]